MRIPVNLASQPFRRDRPFLFASAVVAAGLLALLGLLISLAVMERAQTADSRASVARLDSQLRTLQGEQSRLEAVLRQPENAEVLERSVFLNTLLQRKGISWTKMLADLEQTVPHNVRVISIRHHMSGPNQVTLDMTVGTEAPDPFIGFLRSLESSEVFSGAYLHSSLPPSQTEPIYRYRVSVNYAQKL